MLEIKDKIIKTIENMGSTPDEIAAFLEGQGIKGVPHAPGACALAVYLNKVIGEPYFISVTAVIEILGPKQLYEMEGGSSAWMRTQLDHIPCSLATTLFVEKFDWSAYPQLIDYVLMAQDAQEVQGEV